MAASNPNRYNQLVKTYDDAAPYLSIRSSPGIFKLGDILDAKSSHYDDSRSTMLLGIAADIATELHRSASVPQAHQATAAYQAAIRRGHLQKLAKRFGVVASQSTREDFAVCVFPLSEDIRKTLETLADASHEGNTREILRRVRDTLIDGGWSQYRHQGARTTTIAVLDYLSRTEVVTPQDVQRLSDQMRKSGLNIAGIGHYRFDEEGEAFDGEAEGEEVPD